MAATVASALHQLAAILAALADKRHNTVQQRGFDKWSRFAAANPGSINFENHIIRVHVHAAVRTLGRNVPHLGTAIAVIDPATKYVGDILPLRLIESFRGAEYASQRR